MFNSLRFRLTVLFIVLTIIPLVIVATTIAYRGSDTLSDQTVTLQENLARQTAISLGAFFQERQNELVVLTRTYGLEYLDGNTQRDVLLALLTDQTAYYELALARPDGQETLQIIRGETITTADLASRADDPIFQTAVETGNVNFSPVYFNENARDRLITINIPVRDLLTGQIGYVLIAEVRFQTIQEAVLRELDLAEGEDVYVLDGNGVVIGHRNPNLVINETVFDRPETSGRHTGLTGDDVILAAQPVQLENQNLYVVAEKSYAEATALASDLTQLAAVVTGITLLVAGAFLLWSVNRLVKPITEMSHVAQAIQAGDLSARAREKGSTEVATLGRAFNAMTQQLKDLIGSLEQRVNARTRDLKIATQVSEQMATILDIDQLLPQMVELTKSSFGLYHAHTYLLDTAGENLVLAAGAGEAGEVMKQRKHSIPANTQRSIVARAARENKPVVIDDVRQYGGFMANPLLPDTRSEAAFPLAVGDRVLGVLDVQSAEVGHFDEGMQSVLITLAGQVSVAIDNARLFSEVERTSRHEQALGAITQEIARATNMDEVLQIAARELGKALRVPYTAIELQMPSASTPDSETPVQDIGVEQEVTQPYGE